MSSIKRSLPFGIQWRSSRTYIIATAGTGMFTDLFLYGLVVPILPFILSRRLHVAHDEIQEGTSLLLAYYAGASVIASLPAGYIADILPSRQQPFLCAVVTMFVATALLWLGQNWTILVLARILQGISGSVVWTAGLAMVIDTVGSRHLGVTFNSIIGFVCAGELASPVAGGVIYEYLGEGWVFGLAFLILVFDFIIRALVVEKKVMKRKGWDRILAQNETSSANESSPLISNKTDNVTTLANDVSESEHSKWKLPAQAPYLLSKFPILYLTFNSPRIMASLVLSFTHAMCLAVFDATIPIQGLDLFSITPRSAGLLFVPLILPYILLSPVAGIIIDRYGTKISSTIGLLVLAIPVSLLGIIHGVSPGHEGYVAEMTKYSILLLVCGVGLASIASQSLIDESFVIENYEKANPEWFPNGGPYATLYAMNSMIFSLGLTLGPLLGSYIKIRFGYAVMNYCLAGWCVFVSILSGLFIGEKFQICTRTTAD